MPQVSDAIQEEKSTYAAGLSDFINTYGKSPFHVVKGAIAALGEAEYVSEGSPWSITPGKTYYTIRNGSSLIAFRVGRECAHFHFQIAAAHSDAPTFKVKSQGDIDGPQGYRRLNVEAYGGAIDYSWFDRPLSFAGRAMVKCGTKVESRLFSTNPVAIIPSLAIHMQRDVNSNFSVNAQRDMCPMVAAPSSPRFSLNRFLAEHLGVNEQALVSHDTFLVNDQPARIWGSNSEFISAPKLDDLACAYCALESFVNSQNDSAVCVCALFDNEEVGSNTKQGAMSTFLADTLQRINASLGKSQEDYCGALAKSILVSCDNAHALHPNRPECADDQNHPVLNSGIVVKETANQKYCSDAFSRAIFLELCKKSNAPVQVFANRSDMVGGSTLGNLSNTQVSVHGVDVGLPQLAMHSSYETAGAFDVAYACRALECFYSSNIVIDESNSFEIRS